jgi:hypothetical protein
MPTRKQRRKRQKELRHDYEVVYVDEEGHEVDANELPDAATASKSDARRNGKRDAKPARGGSSSTVRKVDPPSWKRVMRRAALFAPLIFVALGLLDHQRSIVGKVALTAVYTAFFIPFMYLMDRAMYRQYLRRSGNLPPPAARRR